MNEKPPFIRLTPGTKNPPAGAGQIAEAGVNLLRNRPAAANGWINADQRSVAPLR